MSDLNHIAPELRVGRWIDGAGAELFVPVRLSQLGVGPKIIFCFQHWCPGCHSHGFPTLKRLHDAFADRGIGFAAIQTVFEGQEENTFDKLRLDQQRYALPIPFGHDVAAPGDELPTYMQDYHTHGTPWFTVISADGTIAFAGFTITDDAVNAVSKHLPTGTE